MAAFLVRSCVCGCAFFMRIENILIYGGRNMRKRILSWVLSIAIIMSFVPVIHATEVNYDEYLQLLYSDLTNDKIYDNY